MNNLRLLAELLCAVMLGGGLYADAQKVVTLEEIFETAERQSVQLRPSLTAENVAAKELQEARAARLPDINASLSLSFIGDGFTTKRDYSDCQKAKIPHLGTGLGVTVFQPLYTGGAISSAIDLADMKLTASRYASELQRDNLRFRLTGFYLDIYKYINQRSVVESNLASAEKVLKDMRTRFEQGTALQNDITRYELLVSGLQLTLTKIANTLSILNGNLVETAGFPEGTVIVPDTAILDRALSSAGETWWQQQASVNSPTLSLARKNVDVNRKMEDIVRAERMPKIGLTAGWTMDGPILVEVPPINRNLSYWYVGIGINYNLSSLYKSNKSLERSRVATRQAADELDVAAENMRLSVRADYIRYLEAYEELKTQEKNVELARQNYNTVSTRYSSGMALITDMLDAASQKLTADQQLVNARIDIIYYYYKLLFISGNI